MRERISSHDPHPPTTSFRRSSLVVFPRGRCYPDAIMKALHDLVSDKLEQADPAARQALHGAP